MSSMDDALLARAIRERREAIEERDRLRAAVSSVALDYHSLAIGANVPIDIDGNLHPAVTWKRCTAPKCVALRAALATGDLCQHMIPASECRIVGCGA